MRQYVCIVFLLSLCLGKAQIGSERFPVFPECADENEEDVQSCFYKQLYNKLYEGVQQQDISHTYASDAKAVIRLEVTEQGLFNPVLIATPHPETSTALENTLESIGPITPPMFSSQPTYMIFELSFPLPMLASGRFIDTEGRRVDGGIDEEDPYESVLERHAVNQKEYDEVESDLYNGQELTSSSIIRYSKQRYLPYEAAMNRIGTNAHTAVKPYTFNQVGQYYDLEEERTNLTKDVDTWLGRKLWNEHLFEVAGEDYWLVVDPGVDLQLGYDTELQENTYNNTRMAIVSGGIGKHITFGATIQESQGYFAGYFNREIRLRAPDGGNPGIVPGRGVAEAFGEDAFDYPVATGYISYNPSKYFTLQLGHDQQFIGDGYRSLVLSDNANPYAYFKASAEFWKLKFTVLYTSLQDVRSEVTADDTYRPKYMTHHYLSWNVTKRLNLGFFESVLWQNDNTQGFDFNYLNPIIFYQAIELQRGSRGGNALLGLTAKYKFTDDITAYSQFVLDELRIGEFTSGSGNFRNKYGLQLGVKYADAFNISNLYLQAEYNGVRPYTFSHNDIILNYATSNQALAHPWGANLHEIIGLASYQYGRWYGQGKLIYGKRGYDFLTVDDNLNYGGNIYRSEVDRASDNDNTIAQGNESNFLFAQAELGYIINPATNLKGFVSAIYRDSSPQVETPFVQDTSTVWINVGLRTDIFNWYFDR